MGQPLLSKVMPEFTKLLRRRLTIHQRTVETGARYTFFAALLQCGLAPEQVVPESAREEGYLDDLLLDRRCVLRAIIEYKYANASNVTYCGGRVIHDLARLLRWEPSKMVERYFVLVAAASMATHLRNQFGPIFCLSPGEPGPVDDTLFRNQHPSFWEGMKREPWPCKAIVYVIARVLESIRRGEGVHR
jgi:hypothetical protein